jgi:peptidoglycan/LPS O-acetylase OafA/YrhL
MASAHNNIKSLHIIRGICAAIVVVYHSKFILWSGGTLYKEKIGLHGIADYLLFALDMMSSCGAQCVLAFFILSGFVIHYSYTHSNQKLQQFYIIRIIRIYFPYIVSVLFSLITLYAVVTLNSSIAVDGVREYNTRLLNAFNDINITSFLKTMIFVPNVEYAGFNPAYWSLLHEGVFYLLFPIYFYAGTRYRALLFAVVAIAWLFVQSNILYYQLYFMGGMFLYDFYRSGRFFFAHRKIHRIVYMLAFPILYVAINVVVKVNHLAADLATLAILIMAFDLIIYHGIKERKILTELSNVSFSLYLNHMPVLTICYCIFNILLHKLIFFERYPYYVAIPIAFTVCYSSYFVAEKPSLKVISALKKKWNKKDKPLEEPVTVPQS